MRNDLSSDQAYSIAALPDGRIVVGGAMGFGASDYRGHGVVPPAGRHARPRLRDGRACSNTPSTTARNTSASVLVTDTHITMVATVQVPGFSYDRIGLVQCTHDGQLDPGSWTRRRHHPHGRRDHGSDRPGGHAA